jgi:hypothetical protein
MVQVVKKIITIPPDIEGITQKLGIGRLELVSIATDIARTKRVKHTEALRMLDRGEFELEQIRENIISRHQAKIPVQPEDDTPTQSE